MPKRLLPFLTLLLVAGALPLRCLAEEGRVIVKYRASASRQVHTSHKTAGLATRLGWALRSGRRIHDHAEVVRGDGLSSEALAARLAREPEVEYAVPDRLRTIRALPTDPIFPGQWYLQATEAAAIRATEAWDLTTGSANVVVAVIDSGVRFDHPDLSAKLLPGYNFISDAANAGDGDGRDPDASDPGDFISASDASDPNLQAACSPHLFEQNSSWHGTRVAGIVGAAGNNSIGIAGTSFSAKILPVRVLGKCGGRDSDIMAGMRWAAGLPVPGVPDNPNPAKIINLSLGGDGGCTAAFADTIAELTAQGALVVASAGNETGPVQSPGNCAGVLAVGGVRHIGTKVGYSSFGPEVSISAPAGNCLSAPDRCSFSLQTTTNLGTTIPEANGYTDEINFNIGTSFAAPQVAGVAALILSVNPGLTPPDIIALIKRSARAFPTDNTVPTCPNISNGIDSSGQCNCTTAACGAGILDAAAAVAAALPPSAKLVAGWNLIGNGTNGAVDVAGVFGDSSKIATVWKWLSGANAGWAFYTPALPDSGAAHAASNGYAFLTTVNSGEGLWVNAKQDFSVPIGSGNLRATTAFKDGTGPGGANPLPQGWSLIAVGDNPTPRTFTNSITATPPAAGIAAATSLTTLWAWYPGNDVQQPGWFFYAPALDNSGELGSYIGGKGYLDFATLGKFLDATTGFWVNHP